MATTFTCLFCNAPFPGNAHGAGRRVMAFRHLTTCSRFRLAPKLALLAELAQSECHRVRAKLEGRCEEAGVESKHRCMPCRAAQEIDEFTIGRDGA
jgi:hypothetical protein